KIMKINRALLGLSILILGCGISNAQFTDFRNYPLTVVPHESVDSTRGHFWGYMFGSYYTKLHADSVGQGYSQYSQLPKGSNAFSLQRLYLGYDYFFNKQFSAHVVMAHEENADDAYTTSITVDQKNNRIFYLKYANIEWDNIFKGSRLSVGSITTPSFAITEEPFWGYRSIDRTIMDMKGITGSYDLGANLGGKIWSKRDDMGIENACVGYNFMVGNGLGAVPDNAAFLNYYTVWKKYYGDLYVKLLNDKLVLDLYGDGRTLGWTQVPGYAHALHQYYITGRVFLGYKTKNFNISAEYFKQIQKSMLAEVSGPGVPAQGDTIDNIQTGFSVMAAAVLLRDKNTGAPKLSIFARYDGFNPDLNYNPNVFYQPGGLTVNSVPYDLANPITESYYVIGFDFQPIKQIHFMPNIWYDGINNRNNNLTSIEKSDYDLVARITFYYQFFKN
ncbi:MAG TPA: hypothetical protein VK890_01155, partial [Bacteroidia bacterium]|nr:hypothetical protein [Bacteroidia bacterium]